MFYFGSSKRLTNKCKLLFTHFVNFSIAHKHVVYINHMLNWTHSNRNQIQRNETVTNICYDTKIKWFPTIFIYRKRVKQRASVLVTGFCMLYLIPIYRDIESTTEKTIIHIYSNCYICMHCIPRPSDNRYEIWKSNVDQLIHSQ